MSVLEDDVEIPVDLRFKDWLIVFNKFPQPTMVMKTKKRKKYKERGVKQNDTICIPQCDVDLSASTADLRGMHYPLHH